MEFPIQSPFLNVHVGVIPLIYICIDYWFIFPLNLSNCLAISSLEEGVVDILPRGEGVELEGAGDCGLLKPVVGGVDGLIEGNGLIGADLSLLIRLVKNSASTVCSFVFAADAVAGSLALVEVGAGTEGEGDGVGFSGDPVAAGSY
jgi:hypothetical protein